MSKQAEVNKSFKGMDEGPQFLVKHHQDVEYSVEGEFKGTLVLERSQNGGIAWQQVQLFNEPKSGSFHCEWPDQSHGAYRFRMKAFTSGNVNTSLCLAVSEDEKQGAPEPGENVQVRKSVGNQDENEAKLAVLNAEPQNHLEPVGMNEDIRTEEETPSNLEEHKKTKKKLRSA